MSAFQIATTFTAFTAAASSELDEHPASYVTSKVKPQRQWWAQDTDTTPTLTLDQGGTATIAAILLDHVNFPDVLLETSADGLSWTAYDILDTPLVTRLPSTSWPRRAGYALLTGVTARFLRLTPGLLDPGETQHKVGAIALVPAVRTLTRNFNTPVRLGKNEPATRLDYPNAGGETHADGRPFLAGTLVASPWPRPECDADFYALDGLDIGAPFLLFENNGDASAGYVLSKLTNLNRDQFFRFGTFAMDVVGFG